jgi:Homeodomain-like domain
VSGLWLLVSLSGSPSGPTLLVGWQAVYPMTDLVLAWRLKLLREASVTPRSVAQTCRHFGFSRKTFYKWKARYKSHGEAGLCDRPRIPLRSPRATPREVISKILYLRQRYHFGPGRIADYLRRFHHLTVARSLGAPYSDPSVRSRSWALYSREVRRKLRSSRRFPLFCNRMAR